MNNKLLSLLDSEETKDYWHYVIFIAGCETLLQQATTESAVKSLTKARGLARLSLKNLEWDCIQRINSILDLCHGRI